MAQLEEVILITVQERIMIRKRGLQSIKLVSSSVGNGQWCYIDARGGWKQLLLYLQNIDGKLYHFEKFKSIFSASGFLC